MIYIVLLFLFLSILFYLLLGGADYGVGVLELFSSKSRRKITKETAYRVIGPVWEANHVWLILCLVILWVIFPSYYNVIVTQLHIPLSLLLVGIIARGTAFVFRHYDAYKDESHRIYDRIFELSSVFTPLMIGMSAGALISGKLIHPLEIDGQGFLEMYVHGWFNVFSVLIGVFVVAICAYSSAVFLIGETEGSDQKYYLSKALRANVVVVIAGVLVFLESYVSDGKFIDLMLASKTTMIAIAFVTLLIPVIWKYVTSTHKYLARILLGLQITLMIVAWVGLAFPNLIVFRKGELSILDNLPNEKVINSMGWSLLVAAVFILPGLYHLFKTFGLVTKKK